MNKIRAFLSILMVIALIGCSAGADESTRVIVSLGDSYSCGEGVEPFYGQEEEMAVKCQNPDWLAHRSPAAWPGLLTLPGVDGPMKDHRGENWFFVAASGAMTDHLFLLTEEEKAKGMTAEQEKKYNREGISGTAMLAPQLDIFDELDAKGLKADYVTVTIGGNDIGFQSNVSLAFLGVTGLLRGTIEEKAETLWRTAYKNGRLRRKFIRAFTDIAQRAGDQAWIIVAGYPALINPEGGQGGFPETDAQVMNAVAAQFSAEIESIVAECSRKGMKICYVSVAEAFEGHGAYTEDPYINPVYLGAKPQDLKEITMASIYSMHLNEKGNQVYAQCVQAVIDELEAGK